MKSHNKITLAALCIFFLLSGFLFFQKQEHGVSVDPSAAVPFRDDTGLTPVDIQDYSSFRKAVMPLIDEMASKKIVSLGEGTHGTHEFNKIRFWITKILVEEKGFKHVAFENDYSDAYFLDEGLEQHQDPGSLMRRYLIRIWQNREVEELLQWMQAYNASHTKKVHFGGIDNMYVRNDARALQKLLMPLKHEPLNELLNQLVQHSLFQDSIWNHQNDTTFTFDVDQLNKNGVRGWQTVDTIEQLLRQITIPAELKEQSLGFLKDSKQGFNSFYQWNVHKRGSSRDSCMAEMAGWITRKKEDKLVIWAHNGHVAKSRIMGGVVGGAGGFIEQKLPGQYFVLGTGTAHGSFAATNDNIINYSNTLNTHLLEAPRADSWEKKLSALAMPAFYASTVRINPSNDTLHHRHVGYSPMSGDGAYDNTNLQDLYDAFFFIRETSAARFLE